MKKTRSVSDDFRCVTVNHFSHHLHIQVCDHIKVVCAKFCALSMSSLKGYFMLNHWLLHVWNVRNRTVKNEMITWVIVLSTSGEWKSLWRSLKCQAWVIWPPRWCPVTVAGLCDSGGTMQTRCIIVLLWTRSRPTFSLCVTSIKLQHGWIDVGDGVAEMGHNWNIHCLLVLRIFGCPSPWLVYDARCC